MRNIKYFLDSLKEQNIGDLQISLSEINFQRASQLCLAPTQSFADKISTPDMRMNSSQGACSPHQIKKPY